MVLSALQQVPTKGRISVMKIQNFTVQKRHSVIKLLYGTLLVLMGTIAAAINPIEIITHWFVDMREGSFIFKMWEKPTYEMVTEVWLFNYTNVEEYISGAEKVMRVKEVGPFKYKEVRENDNLHIDRERGVLTMNPTIRLQFIREGSCGDPDEVLVTMPNLPLIALSTLAADKLGYLANVGAYYSMMALGPKLFQEMSAQKVLWGYEDRLVTIANGLLPGWIDFNRLGLLDRIYAQRHASAEVEIKDSKRLYSLITWDNSTGLKEQGFTDWNTSIPCNRINGTFEGFMVPPNFEKGRNITLFRKQACRTLPFRFIKEKTSDYGFPSYEYTMEENAFSRSSPYDCACKSDCLPEGFIDISECYYGFPIRLTKPHFMDVDPVHQAYFEGMHPNRDNHSSYYELQPTLGIPLQFAVKAQINLAVKMSPGNTLTKPVKDKILPLFWLQVVCKAPPSEVITLLKLRLVIGPPLYIVSLVVIFLAGFGLGAQGFYRIWKPRYKLLPPAEPMVPIVKRKSQERRRSSVHENIAFMADDDTAKEAMSLLAINEEDSDFVELIICDEDDLE